MAFTNYVPPLLNPQQAGVLPDIIGNILGGYTGVKNAQYLPREKEAEIFHKQISPLAMLASSPYFSSLHPEQQAQMAQYISQMLSRQGLGENQIASNQGFQTALPSANFNNQGINGGQNNNISEGNTLVPQTPGEHFTGKYTQSPYSPGTAFRGKQGETIYTPTGSNVQKGIEVLTETKGLKKLFDEYSKIAPEIGGAGGFKRDFSKIASGISKTGLPYSQKISEYLGGPKLSNAQAQAESYKAQMAPALRAIGFTNKEINNILDFYPGETEQNIKDKLKNAWPVVERKIKSYQKNLKEGINVSNKNVINENDIPKSIDQKIARDQKERDAFMKLQKKVPSGTVGLYRKGELYYIPENEVNEALAAGFRYE